MNGCVMKGKSLNKGNCLKVFVSACFAIGGFKEIEGPYYFWPTVDNED